MDLFTAYLRKRNANIHNDNRFIYFLPVRESVNMQLTMIIDLFPPAWEKKSVNISFIILIDLFIPHLRRKEF